MLKKYFTNRRTEKLEKTIAELETELALQARTIAIQAAELDAMAAVIARDRERVKAESAAFVRPRAESEGTNNGQTR